MNKLPNAPLVEVIFELRWAIQSKEELDKHQYLHGDLYAKIKNEYPFRESLQPQEVPMELYLHNPSHRFRVAEDNYPLIQVGPGLLTVNTNDSKYEWEEYKNRCVDAMKNLHEVFDLVKTKENIILILQYQDFIRFDFEEYNVYNYLRENLHIDIKQSFYETQVNPYSLNLRFNYQIDFGKLEVHLQQAKKNNTDEDGILIRTVIADAEANSDETYIINWLDEAHQITSQIFRKMTEGELYESFKSSKYYDRIK